MKRVGALVVLAIALTAAPVPPAAQAVETLAVSSTLTLDASPPTTAVGDQIDLTGQLTFGDASSSAGQTVTVTRDDAGGSRVVGTPVTDSNGMYAMTDVVDVGGLVTYHAHFDATLTVDAADSQDATVSVAKLPTRVSIAVSDHAVTFGRSVRITGHLGHGTESKVLAIYAKPDGGSQVLVRKAKVGRHRDLRASFAPPKDTTFIARYDGDLSHRGARDGALTRVRVIVTATLTRYASTAGRYRIYRKGSRAPCVVRVKPNHRGFKVHATLQAFVQGSWRTLATKAFRLNSASAVGFAIRGSSGVNWRVMVRLPTHNDHLGDTSGWRYLRFS